DACRPVVRRGPRRQAQDAALHHGRARRAPPRRQRLRGDHRRRARPDGGLAGGGRQHDRPALRPSRHEAGRGLHARLGLRRPPYLRDRRPAELGGVVLLPADRSGVNIAPMRNDWDAGTPPPPWWDPWWGRAFALNVAGSAATETFRAEG